MFAQMIWFGHCVPEEIWTKAKSRLNHRMEREKKQHRSLIAHFTQLHQQVHKLLILCKGSLAELKNKVLNTHGCSGHSRFV
jgi:hypothetical protein